MIDPKDITPGYWYILRDPSYYFANGRLYTIVEVDERGFIGEIGNDDNQVHKDNSNMFFLAPVPDPIGKPEEAILKLKKEMGLPDTASTAQVFKEALRIAREAAAKYRKEHDV